MEEVLPERIFPSLVALFIVVWIIWFIWLFNVLYLEPNKIRLKLQRQGIKGPPPAFVMGNIPEMKRIMSMAADAPRSETDHLPLGFSTSTTFPYFTQWTKRYVREINLSKTLDLGKPSYLQKDRGPLLGKGLITSNGAVWLHQRKTIAPQLFMDKVKGNLNIMVESVSDLVNSWLGLIELGRESADIRVDDYIRSFTSTVISKMMFGSHHSKGVELFPKCRALMKDLQTPTILKGIPFFRYLPTKENRDVWRLEKEIYASLIDIVKEHPEAASDNTAQISWRVLRLVNLGHPHPTMTAVATLWGLVLLASNPEWQARLRAEVLEVCGGHVPDTNMLGKMKLMVIQEVLRLYPGVAFVSRQALKDVKLGDILVPKGVNIWIWIPALHQDPELWGSDAEKFNPERFANGILGACKSPNAYIPFGKDMRESTTKKMKGAYQPKMHKGSGNPFKVVVYHILIGGMTGFDHQDGVSMVSVLMYMVTHWTRLTWDVESTSKFDYEGVSTPMGPYGLSLWEEDFRFTRSITILECSTPIGFDPGTFGSLLFDHQSNPRLRRVLWNPWQRCPDRAFGHTIGGRRNLIPPGEEFYPADFPPSPDILHPEFYPADIPPSSDISHPAPDAGWERRTFQLPRLDMSGSSDSAYPVINFVDYSLNQRAPAGHESAETPIGNESSGNQEDLVWWRF
uniref:Cytochrome P450 714C2 n=1 Tax=Vitis vinifera TaxID=29760 RepID=A5AT07_VITVI|nr:hypothetical protein VITISV_039811 [Vitis vinifera]